MVFEITEGGEVHEHVGVFKDYSAQFVEFLDVQYPQRQGVPIQIEKDAQTDRVHVWTGAGQLHVENLKEEPLLIQTLRWGGQERFLNVVVDGGEKVDLHLDGELSQAELHMQVVRELDMVLPRTHCVVRHRAEYYKAEDVGDVVFDMIWVPSTFR